MSENQAGITALVTAYARAYHATHDSPVVFDDALADQMYTPEEHAQFNQNLAGMLSLVAPDLAATRPDPATALAWSMQLMNEPVTLSRSRYTEDCLEQAARLGARQYVILGAGFDTFAFRRPDLLAALQVFELDHPVTQAMKRQRIALAGWHIPPQLHFVATDFTQEDLPAALRRSPYDPEQVSFFSWLGVSFYLPHEAVFATLRAIAGVSPKGSSVVFDYMDTAAFDPARADRRVQLMQGIARQVGEPMKAGFDPQSLGRELSKLGLTLVENLGPAEIEARYFQGRADRLHAFPHVHFAKVVVA
jgi:methyltransferase (TIGR00027 family)